MPRRSLRAAFFLHFCQACGDKSAAITVIKMTSKPVVEADFVELPDGTLLDTIEDPNNPGRTLLAVYRDRCVHYTDHFEADDRICVPISRSTDVLKHLRFSRGAKSYESSPSLLAALITIISMCLDMPYHQIALLSCFIVSTWFIEKLPIAPYVALVGLPRSGKTTALRLLDLLCRRSLLTSDITSAGFYETCNRVTPTLLIDETATAGDRRALFHLLRVGSTKGSVAIRRNKAFNAYCPKVVCWTELPHDAALNSRCIIISSQETDQTDLRRVTDPQVQAHADDLRQMLQQYRFENFNRLTLPRVPGDEHLHSRIRDLYEALALPIGDPITRKALAGEFQLQQNINRESLSPIQVALLQGLDEYIHENSTDPTCANRDLTEAVNVKLEYSGETLRASPRQTGHALTLFGLTRRQRTNTGWVLLLTRDTRERIHRLIRRYAVEIGNSENRDGCDFCTGRKPPASAETKPIPDPHNPPPPDAPEGESGEHRELRARKSA
jgi:hypothetical protein